MTLFNNRPFLFCRSGFLSSSPSYSYSIHLIRRRPTNDGWIDTVFAQLFPSISCKQTVNRRTNEQKYPLRPIIPIHLMNFIHHWTDGQTEIPSSPNYSHLLLYPSYLVNVHKLRSCCGIRAFSRGNADPR